MGLFSGLADFFGASDRRDARKYGALADDARDQMQEYQQDALGVAAERRDAEGAYIDSQQQRFDSLYAPMEQQLASELNRGPQTGQAAAIASGDFAGEYDSTIAGRDRQQMRSGVSYQPGSSASRMQGENDAYNRARGIAGAKTDARREEEDSHFLKQNAFFNANANSIQNRVQQGMTAMYGADYNSYNTAATQSANNATYNQGISNQYSQQSNAGINTLTNLAGSAIGGLTGGLGANTAQYLNNGVPNQATAAINGEVSNSYIYNGT